MANVRSGRSSAARRRALGGELGSRLRGSERSRSPAAVVAEKRGRQAGDKTGEGGQVPFLQETPRIPGSPCYYTTS